MRDSCSLEELTVARVSFSVDFGHAGVAEVADAVHWKIQPSLREFGNCEFEPGSELPDYFRISHREIKAGAGGV